MDAFRDPRFQSMATPGVTSGALRTFRTSEPLPVETKLMAPVTAMSLSGFLCGEWVFAGFLPRAGAKLRRKAASLAAERRAVVFMEGPHRLLRTLRALRDASSADAGAADAGGGSEEGPGIGGAGDAGGTGGGRWVVTRQLAICRELTKEYEEVFRGTVDEALEHFGDGSECDGAGDDGECSGGEGEGEGEGGGEGEGEGEGGVEGDGDTARRPRGEFTVVLDELRDWRDRTLADEAALDATIEDKLRALMAAGGDGASVSTSGAARAVAKELGVSRSRVFPVALALAKAQQNQSGGRDWY